MTSQPSSSRADDNAPACFFAREISTRQPVSGGVLRATFLEELLAKVGIHRLRRRKPSAASTQDDNVLSDN
jgi:hypothetical protein